MIQWLLAGLIIIGIALITYVLVKAERNLDSPCVNCVAFWEMSDCSADCTQYREWLGITEERPEVTE